MEFYIIPGCFEANCHVTECYIKRTRNASMQSWRDRPQEKIGET